MKGLQVTEHTLVGTSGERPSDWGNCFSMKCDDGKHRRIINFNLENLEALQELGLKLPLKLKAMSDRLALVMDGRIGERWYNQRYCEVCCPSSLLPVTQLDRHERAILRGQREEHEVTEEGPLKGHVIITTYPGKEAEFK